MSQFLGVWRTPMLLLLSLWFVQPAQLVAAQTPHRPLIFAAASLKDGLDAVLEGYQHLTGVAVRASYAGTPVLARQIEAGAPANLFFSADQQWMDYLEERGLVNAQTRVDVLANALVLVSAGDCDRVDGQRLGGNTLSDWLGDGGLAMAHPNTVPAGRYGQSALKQLALWRDLRGRIIEVENVRLALMLAARGEVPLALVYASDASVEPDVVVCHHFAADTHPAIRYPLVAVESELSVADRELLTYLSGAEAAQVWRKYGFEALSGSARTVNSDQP